MGDSPSATACFRGSVLRTGFAALPPAYRKNYKLTSAYHSAALCGQAPAAPPSVKGIDRERLRGG